MVRPHENKEFGLIYIPIFKHDDQKAKKVLNVLSAIKLIDTRLY